jgi:hypothetical protein
MARQAARSGYAIVRYSQPELMTTRFGAFEVVDLVLGANGREPACAGFRLRIAEPALMIAGVACGSAAAPLKRADLACALERLDLVSAGEDRALGAFFASSELRRGTGCPSERTTERPSTRRGGARQGQLWLDKPAKPPMRGTLAELRRP